MRLPSQIILATLILLASQSIHCHNVLLFCANVPSHVLYFGQLGEELMKNGHNMTLVFGSKLQTPNQLIQVTIPIKKYLMHDDVVIDSPIIGNSFINRELGKESVPTHIKTLISVNSQMMAEAEALYQDEKTMAELKASNFDFAIVDPLHQFMILPYLLGIPYAGFSLGPLMHSYMHRRPIYPSYMPHALLGFTDHMNLLQRTLNFIVHILSHPLHIYSFSGGADVIKKYVPNRPAVSYGDLVTNMSLVFILDIPLLSPIEPNMPNTFQIGSIMGREADVANLPSELNSFINNAEEGFIIVSFGSWMDRLPDFVIQKIVAAFVPMNIKIIWKMRFPLEHELPEHILTLPWIPQNYLLGHPNVKALVTHCGVNSIIEALYHGVPIVGLPLGADQVSNGRLLANKGYGIVLSLANFAPEDLLGALVQVSRKGNKYKSAMLKASAVIKDLPNGGSIASFWISHVVKHGGNHLRSYAFELQWYEYYSVDVMLIWSVILYVVWKFAKILCSLLYCRKRKSKQD